jgi:hypothetical protein
MSKTMDDLVEDFRFWSRINGLSRMELSKLLNITPQAMSYIFLRRNNPSGETTLAMLKIVTERTAKKPRKLVTPKLLSKRGD